MDEDDSQMVGEAAEATAQRKEELWRAFRSGFAAGRESRYYAELPAISQRAARTEFEQFYKSSIRED